MYFIVFGLLYLLSLLPLRVLYLFSDFAYILIYYVIGYRKKIVMQNLTLAFPDKTETDRKEIARKFYRSFTDNFIETIKLISASNSFIKKHFHGDYSVVNELYKKGKKCHVHLGHNFNWEMANLSLPLYSPYTMLTVYMPITSKVMNRLLMYIRIRTGANLLPAIYMRNAMVPYRNKVYLMALVADQNPGVPKRAHWFHFFGKPTPFQIGPEKAAKGSDAAVVFCRIIKRKRGYYEPHFKLVTEDPKSYPETVLTQQYVAYLEDVIRDQPETWLWSHRRWKWEWKPEYGRIIK
jgi:KDO2-lipid IV(A) lauroyltransferase